MTKIEMHRGDVVLIAFPFIVEGSVQRKRRPALVVQADRYNRRREAVIIAAITSSKAHRELPCKVFITRTSAAGRKGGLKLDSVVDCQTLATIPRDEIVERIGNLPAETMQQVGRALGDALQLNLGN